MPEAMKKDIAEMAMSKSTSAKPKKWGAVLSNVIQCVSGRWART